MTRFARRTRQRPGCDPPQPAAGDVTPSFIEFSWGLLVVSVLGSKIETDNSDKYLHPLNQPPGTAPRAARHRCDPIMLLSSLLLLIACIHRWGWTITPHGDGTTTATSPDGTITRGPPHDTR